MSPDLSYVGKALPPSAPYVVGREKLREFASAIGETDPCCHDVAAARAAGHPDLIAPPTFPGSFTMAVMMELLGDPDFGWDFDRMVHGDQGIRFQRPVYAGDELVTTLHVDDLRTRAGSHFLSLRCEVATVDGEAVLTTNATLLTQAAQQ